MLFLFEILMMVFISNVVSLKYMKHVDEVPHLLPDTYKDIFVAGQSGKPTFG